jgi:hypothetical protein
MASKRQEINILSAESASNPQLGATFINVNGVTFRIEDKHVTVYFSNTITGDNGNGSVTFHKESSTFLSSNTLKIATRVVIGSALIAAAGGAAWGFWNWLKE